MSGKLKYPQISQGFARHAGESAHPNLWYKLRGLWLPGIRTGGVTVANAVKDFSLRRNHGSFSGTWANSDWVWSRLPNGISGYALRFDDSDDMVEAPTLDNPPKFTWMCWLKRSSTSDRGTPLSKGGAGSTFDVGIEIEAGDSIRYFVRGDTNWDVRAADGTSSITDTDTWHHVGMTWDGVTLTGYYDGHVDGTPEGGSTKADDSETGIQIGARNNVLDFNGDIMDVRIYDRPLSAREFMDIYDGASPLQLGSSVVAKAPAAGGGATIPIFAHHYQTMRTA